MDDLIELIKTGEYSFPEKDWSLISKEGKDLIKRCLTKDPELRIKPEEALKHDWITKKIHHRHHKKKIIDNETF